VTPLPSDRISPTPKAGALDPLNIGLISLTVALIAGTAAPILYLGAPAADAPKPVAATAAPTARVPHPRPDEPIVTGSIDPIGPAVRQRSEPAPDGAVATETRADAEARRVENLQDQAITIARTWDGCANEVQAEVLQARSSVTDRIVVRIDCGNGTLFYLDQDEIELSQLTVGPGPLFAPADPISDGDAVLACEEKLKQGLPVPSSFSRSVPSTGVDRAPGNAAVVTFEFKALNGLGFPLTMQAHCLFQAREIARLETNPR